MSFAVPGGQRGKALLYGGETSGVVVSSRDCTEMDELDFERGAVPEAVRIEAGPQLTATDAPSDASDLRELLEFFDCQTTMGAVKAADAVSQAVGTLHLEGIDTRAWLLRPSNSDLSAVTDAPGAELDSEFAWAPDGMLAFSRLEMSGAQALYLLLPGDDEPRRLAENGAMPTWSPDGTRLAFVSYDAFSGGSTLQVVGVPGGEPQLLAENAASPAWSPDGVRIAYLTANDGFADPFDAELAELRVIDAGGGSPITLDDRANGYAAPPRWSPDGRTLAYAGGDFDAPELWLVDVDHGDLRVIEGPEAGSFLGEPAWSPDGASLAVTLTGGGMFASTGGLALVDLENDNVNVVIESDSAYYARPVWSPDGRFIAATLWGADMSADAVVIEVDNGTQTRVASGVLAVLDWAER